MHPPWMTALKFLMHGLTIQVSLSFVILTTREHMDCWDRLWNEIEMWLVGTRKLRTFGQNETQDPQMDPWRSVCGSRFGSESSRIRLSPRSLRFSGHNRRSQLVLRKVYPSGTLWGSFSIVDPRLDSQLGRWTHPRILLRGQKVSETDFDAVYPIKELKCCL